MIHSVLSAESGSISVVSSRWLWAARIFALIYAISLVGEYVAAAHFDPLNSLGRVSIPVWSSDLAQSCTALFFVP